MFETPLHPIFTHFPIALLSFGAIFFVIDLFAKKDHLMIIGIFCLIGGLAGAALALVTGNIEHDNLLMTHEIHEKVENHELLAYITSWAFGILLIWILVRRKKILKVEKILFNVLYILGLGALMITAHIGGELVYVEGAGVRPMEPAIEKAFKEEQSGKPQRSDDNSTVDYE